MIAVLLLFAVEMEPKRVEGVQVRFRVELGDEPAGPGLAQARYEFDVRGPAGTQVEGPRLEDAFAAWRGRVETSSTSADGEIAVAVHLVQRKLGPAPLPAVTLRVRSASGPWHDLTWPEPLLEPRDVPPVEPQPPLPPTARWPFAVAGAAALIALVARLIRRRRPRPVEVDPAAEALSRLASGQPDDVEAALRAYVGRRFGVDARAATRRELVALLPSEFSALLDEALRRCEAARFGGADVDAAGPARAFVEATGPSPGSR